MPTRCRGKRFARPTAKLAGFEKAKLLWEYEGGVPHSAASASPASRDGVCRRCACPCMMVHFIAGFRLDPFGSRPLLRCDTIIGWQHGAAR